LKLFFAPIEGRHRTIFFIAQAFPGAASPRLLLTMEICGVVNKCSVQYKHVIRQKNYLIVFIGFQKITPAIYVAIVKHGYETTFAIDAIHGPEFIQLIEKQFNSASELRKCAIRLS
jgi:hypothetical protein